jgi:hypothetical protein
VKRLCRRLSETEAALIARQAVAVDLWRVSRERLGELAVRGEISTDTILELLAGISKVAVAASAAAGPVCTGSELSDQIAAMKCYTIAERRQIVTELQSGLQSGAP